MQTSPVLNKVSQLGRPQTVADKGLGVPLAAHAAFVCLSVLTLYGPLARRYHPHGADQLGEVAHIAAVQLRTFEKQATLIKKLTAQAAQQVVGVQ